MTDLNKIVPQQRNTKLTFWAFEKERWHNIWCFICGKKTNKTADIGVFQLAWNVYKSTECDAKNCFYKLMGCLAIGGFLEGILPYLNMFVYGSLPAVLTGTNKAIMIFAGFLALRVLCTCLLTIFFRLGRVFYARKFEQLEYNQKTSVRYAEIINKPRAFFIVNAPETASSLTNTIVNSEIRLLKWFADFVREFISIITVFISLFLCAPVLSLGMVILSWLDIEQKSYVQAYWRPINHKNRMFDLKVNKINRDILSRTPLIQEAQTTIHECQRIKHRFDHVSHNNINIMSAHMKQELWMDMFLRIATYAMAGAFAVVDMIKTGDVGRFALITGGAYQFLQTVEEFSSEYQEWMVKERNTVIDTEKQLVTPKALDRQCGEKKLCKNDNKIILKDVEFSYPKIKDVTKLESEDVSVERGEKVLLGVNVEITKGGVTVIAGTSGQGKSTLMSLIRHDYDVTGGQVLIGDVNVQDVTDDVINAQISFVDQNVHFFDNTLLYNLKYFNQSASEEDVQRALDSSGFSEDVAQFKDGVFHRIGQDGRALSGGQRQRLALARTFLTDRPIVIMDEPTTGLDQVLSFKVMKALREMSKTKTVLLVTHNPTEIALADRVLVVQGGKIVADGTPLELIDTSNFLSSAMTKQDILSKQYLFRKY